MQFISPLIRIKESLRSPVSTVINSIIMSKLLLFDNIFFINFVLSQDVFLDVAVWLVEGSFCPGSCLTKQRISSRENSKAPNRKDQRLRVFSAFNHETPKEQGTTKSYGSLLGFQATATHTCTPAYVHTDIL